MYYIHKEFEPNKVKMCDIAKISVSIDTDKRLVRMFSQSINRYSK